MCGDGGCRALVSPDGVAPSRMVSVSASVNLFLHYKVRKFSSCTGSPGWSPKNGHKTVVVVELYLTLLTVDVAFQEQSAYTKTSQCRHCICHCCRFYYSLLHAVNCGRFCFWRGQSVSLQYGELRPTSG